MNDRSVLIWRGLYIDLRQVIIIMVSLLCVLYVISTIGVIVGRLHQWVLLHHNGLVLHRVENIG